MPLSRCATPFVGLMLAVAASSHAQTLTTMSCTDARAQTARGVQPTNGVIANRSKTMHLKRLLGARTIRTSDAG